MDPDLDARLPEPYARALELAAAGCSDEVLARSLGIDVAAVPTLLDIARAKAASAAPLTLNVDDFAAEQQSGCDPDA